MVNVDQRFALLNGKKKSSIAITTCGLLKIFNC